MSNEPKDMLDLKRAFKIRRDIKNFEVLVNVFNNDPTIMRFMKKGNSKTGSILKETKKVLDEFNKIQLDPNSKKGTIKSGYKILSQKLTKILNKAKKEKENSTIKKAIEEFEDYLNYVTQLARERLDNIKNSETLSQAFDEVTEKIKKIDSKKSANAENIAALYISEMFKDEKVKQLMNRKHSATGKALSELCGYVNGNSLDFKELTILLKNTKNGTLPCLKAAHKTPTILQIDSKNSIEKLIQSIENL